MAIKQVTAVQAMEEISKGKIITASLNEMQGAGLLWQIVRTAGFLPVLTAANASRSTFCKKKTAAKLKT